MGVKGDRKGPVTTDNLVWEQPVFVHPSCLGYGYIFIFHSQIFFGLMSNKGGSSNLNGGMR